MTEGRRPTCYIHVGPHKTGSSSIKHFILGNLETLSANGLHYPKLEEDGADRIATEDDGRTGRPHRMLAHANEIKSDGALKATAKLWRKIDDVALGRRLDILLSSEEFSRSLSVDDVLERVLAFFETRGYRVVILAYVRDQPAWLNSWYVQSQKRFAELMSFDAFVAEADLRGRVEPWRYLKRFIDEPRCELQVISFEQAAKAGLEADFIRRCGIGPEASLVDNPLRNPNAGAKTVFAAQEIMRRAGSGLRDLDGFHGVYSVFKRRYRQLGWEETPFSALTEETDARIRDRYAESNESFAQAFFGVSWTEICPSRPFKTSVFDPASASWWERWRIERLVRETASGFQALRRADAASGRSRRPRAG